MTINLALRPGDTVTADHLHRLPTPVARFLHHAGVVGTRVPRRFHQRQHGRIRMKPDGPWLPLTARQTYTLDPPGFVWEARARFAPLLYVHGTDTLVDGNGHMVFRLAKLVKVVDASGPDMDQGVVMRYLNETMWFPWAMLTRPISWQPIDDRHARAHIEVGDISDSGVLTFDDTGRLLDFEAMRYHNGEPGSFELWSTPVDEYGVLAGLRVPVHGYADWHLADGDFRYIELNVHDGVAEV